MSSSSAPVSSLSEGRVSFRFWDFEIASTPNPSANWAVLTGGQLINELELVWTDISSLNGWRFALNSWRSAGTCQCYRKFRWFACTSPSKLSLTSCD